VAGGLIGVFFGLAFGGNRKWRVWDYLFGPEEKETDALNKPKWSHHCTALRFVTGEEDSP